jgi:VanZ family protein
MLGPFQGAERHFGLNDFAAHAIAFYGLACLCFLAGPRLRRNDLALVLLALGAAAEVAQAAVGRSASFHDLAADAVGILAAWAPSQIETLRTLARERPHQPLRRRASDRPAGVRDRGLARVRAD